MKLTSWIPAHWNDRQREVWQNLDNHWQCLIGKKVEEFLKYIHPDFIGYGHESPLPVDRPWLEKWVGFWTKSTEIVICELRPIDLRFHGDDIAILQYFIFTIETNPVDRGKRVIRRYTMTWKKSSDRWVVIASHNNLMNDALHG
ncbi:MAG: nuclear transport factor 2 family protein [Candidatus Omnitrophica bacterium]|nr:nuclear transport factor 2 family protein [Candidatus Omnitrophota bacterium]